MAAVEPERAQEQPTVLESPPVPALRTISAEDLESALTASLSAILFVKRSEIDLAKNFVDLGLDSIIGVEWIQALNNEYGLSMPASRIYSFPTMREFSKFVRKELDERPQAAPKAPPPVSSVAASPDVLRQLLDGIQQGSIEIDAAERLFQDLCQGVA
jgi:polyketide synthase PksN